jgi:tRNA G10  N-methylase Trm11
MVRHPAVFSNAFLPIFSKYLQGCKNALDPFAGTGKIAQVKKYGWDGIVLANEIETEWAATCILNGCDGVFSMDAEKLTRRILPAVDAIVTSPTYGNRMADHFRANDASRRITYTHCLGRDLSRENTGKMPFGNAYKEKHAACYSSFRDLLADDGLFILNTKNFIKDGGLVDVTAFHVRELQKYFILMETIRVPCQGMRFGANSKLRVDFESIHIFRKRR